MNTEQPQTRRLLVDGVQALVAGRREQARNLLMQCLEHDERNAEAWLWLSGAMDEKDDVQVALENCLNCDPHNEQARQGLDWLQTKYKV